ncbi:M20/M25/M40 family metallo-hydrolase [Kitasatospora sp. NPDC002040]|uniref:M20 family metallopeptidase n=1 Tax=Kitasatospora sp. NPDC002040 TaxID=3154661 RepID=UPI00332D08E7
MTRPTARTQDATHLDPARIDAARDDAQALELLRAAVAVPSVTGNEAAFARFVGDRLTDLCDRVVVDEFAPDRANVWSSWGGSPEQPGPGLLFAGHLDTVHVTGWQEHWAGTEREDPFGAAVVDGSVWGRGVGDLKAGIAAVLAALQLLHRAGYAPLAPIRTLFVADEESGEPGSGTSEGIRRALKSAEEGRIDLSAELAVYVEPTTMQVYTAHMGFFITEITLTGKSAYFGTPELGVDALRAADEVLRELWRHDEDLRVRPGAPLIGSPSLLVTGINGGGYVSVPGECRISLIRKLVPGEDLDSARTELDSRILAAVTDPRIAVQISYPAGRDHPVGGTSLVTDSHLEPIRALQAAVAAELPDRGRIAAAPYWSEGPFLAARLGLPTVYCAPGDISNCHTFDEHVEVAEYLSAVRVYARFIADRCGLRDLRD